MKYFRFAALALLAPCAALANVTDDVEAVGGALIPSLGLSIDVAGNSSLANHTRGLSHSIDVGFAYARAKTRQDRDAGDQPIIFGGTVFPGAAGDIDWTSNVQLFHLGYRPRYWFGNSNFALEGLVGLGWAGMGVKGVSNTGLSASERLSNGGIVLGIGGIWRFAPSTALQVRAISFGSGKEEGVTSAGRWELTVTHAMARNLNVRAGLGVLSARSTREDSDDNIRKSPVTAGGVGVTIGLDFVF
ncbi:MAG: hypothetical protein QOD26_3184 [Betaproteobacteria bacterium]|jgi:hypothetical protein|nr:hypothetical protein [Betaproteobacteria bacterium]